MNQQSYSTITVSLPLQHVTQRTAIEIHKEMRRRRPETLRDAPEVVAKQFDEVLKAGEKLKRESSLSDVKHWVLCMRHLEEVLSLFCTYDLKRWLSAFGGLRLILEKEARRASPGLPQANHPLHGSQRRGPE